MHVTRASRLAQELQHEIATIIHQELKDPHIGFVTITRLELSKDARHAKVLFSCLGSNADRRRSQHSLDRSARFIQGLIKKRFRMKVIPELVFRYDESIIGSVALDEALGRIRSEQQPAPPSEESA